MDATTTTPTWLDLFDWRQRVAALYQTRNASLRAGDDPAQVCQTFRQGRDALFKAHPQSPLSPAVRATFTTLPYFAYDPAFRVTATLTPVVDGDANYSGVTPAGMQYRRAGIIGATPFTLHVYWIDVYGGGLFIPFRDPSNDNGSYSGGRYLIDTVKGSDLYRPHDPDALGYQGGEVVVDFNYAYNPSCAYDDRWFCPLAPRENALPVAILAGEKAWHV